jgi:hypothetical protein
MSHTRINQSLFSNEQWIAWWAATTIAVISACAYFYTTFLTHTSFSEYRDAQTLYLNSLDKRLERIENKLDQLIQGSSK